MPFMTLTVKSIGPSLHDSVGRGEVVVRDREEATAAAGTGERLLMAATAAAAVSVDDSAFVAIK